MVLGGEGGRKKRVTSIIDSKGLKPKVWKQVQSLFKLTGDPCLNGRASHL